MVEKEGENTLEGKWGHEGTRKWGAGSTPQLPPLSSPDLTARGVGH